ncbi:YlxM family DNA-binding protein [Leuconostocaceae bacterium ESL0723]|nr:YlxM family DNA-binding protein [Lactobacillaceae bacterium L1_55_11]WEV54971.1 YlxM family DNA-binding protein [Leuconostocaceae bacterium ESL0723]
MDLAKKNEINALLGFYQPLLTDKQQEYLQDYCGDDYSIIEIAEAHGVSRQAVSDNLNRGVELLEHYEGALHLWADYQVRSAVENELVAYVQVHNSDDYPLRELVRRLVDLEGNE